jgi:cytochrome c oxidase subunit 2
MNKEIDMQAPKASSYFLFQVLAFLGLTLSISIGSVPAKLEAARPWNLDFQDPGSPVAEGIFFFHHDLMFIIVAIAIFVGYFVLRVIQLFSKEVHPVSVKTLNHGTFLEIVWTTVPAIILLFVAAPSFSLLYSVDEVIDPGMTLKVCGRQWYWSYEYSDFEGEEGLSFDSYMIATEDLTAGSLRLLEVDNRVVLPVDTHIRLIITASDVLHCWGIPSLGLKIDACPGRLNQSSLFLKRPGVYYGQCSEICGQNHGFIPIVVEAVSMEDFSSWVEAQLEELSKTLGLFGKMSVSD